MIPFAALTLWRTQTPWASDAQVEQDLLLSRALVEIFSDPLLKDHLAFRGGTALHKLFLLPAARYSEDIDLVQIHAGPFGPCMTALRARLDPWLGEPKRKQSEGRVTFIYRATTETEPKTPMRLKVEVNTREHFSVLGYQTKPFLVENPWFSGEALIQTYHLEELLGTKLRALYQRKKGRDLFDLDHALQQVPTLDPQRVIDCFQRYTMEGKTPIRREAFLTNLQEKAEDTRFGTDIPPLLRTGEEHSFLVTQAIARIQEVFLARLPL